MVLGFGRFGAVSTPLRSWQSSTRCDTHLRPESNHHKKLWQSIYHLTDDEANGLCGILSHIPTQVKILAPSRPHRLHAVLSTNASAINIVGRPSQLSNGWLSESLLSCNQCKPGSKITASSLTVKLPGPLRP